MADFTQLYPDFSRGRERKRYRGGERGSVPASVIAPNIRQAHQILDGQGASGRNELVAWRQTFLTAHPQFKGGLPELCDAIEEGNWWGQRCKGWIAACIRRGETSLLIAWRLAFIRTHPKFKGCLRELRVSIRQKNWWGRRCLGWIRARMRKGESPPEL